MSENELKIIIAFPLGMQGVPRLATTAYIQCACVIDIQKNTVFQDGDVCNVDVTVYHRGFHGDLNESFFVGNVPESTRKLVQVSTIFYVLPCSSQNT